MANEMNIEVMAQEARQKAANSGVGYAASTGTVAGHWVEVSAFRTSRSAKYQLRWMVDGKAVSAARLQGALA